MIERRSHNERGMTLLEIMVVIAIIGIGLVLLRTGVRGLTKADLVEDTEELAAMLRRASLLAIEKGEQHRVVIDVDKGIYRIDVCQGPAALAREEAITNEEEKTKKAIEKGTEKLRDLPSDALAVGDPDEAMRRAKAIAGHHIADRTCTPAVEGITGVQHNAHKAYLKVGEQPADWIRNLNVVTGIKFQAIWVQHKIDPTKKGDVAIYFMPNGSAEKAVIELTNTDGDVRTIMVHGLTGRIQQKTGKLDDVDSHMLRNVMNEREKARESEK
jgi:prepilin-type N-terminal cleavage/methylation domain-containing protein